MAGEAQALWIHEHVKSTWRSAGSVLTKENR